MKIFYAILFFGITSIFHAQNIAIDTLNSTTDTIYIEDHKKQFNVKFDVSNDVVTYSLPKEGVTLNIKPNLNLKYALVLSYKFASVRLGIRPRPSEEEKKNKGDSKTFRIHFKLLFDYWSHNFDYNYYKGYYIVNTEDFVPEVPKSDFRIQFPDMTTNVFSGSSSYKFNENYSVRAIASQTEIQVKSVGSFIPGILYSYYKINGADKILFPEDNIELREEYSDIQGIDLTLTAGYYYTFVYKKYWFANAYLTPGLGIDFYKSTQYSSEDATETTFNNDINYLLKSGVGIGYNGEKIFFGANFANRISSEKFNENKIQLQISKNSFHIYLGYRFKAPKPVSKSVDLIEEKIPILNDKNKKK